jgi:prepilin-type N-terminal cleavage/methylation domain-containing protein
MEGKVMKRKNEGFTLIELIVVIAIMAVMTAAFGVSFTLIGRQRVSTAASSFKENFTLAQTYAKSKGACKLTLIGSSEDDSATYIYTAANTSELSDPDKCKLGNGPNDINKNVTVSVYFVGNSTPYVLEDGVQIDIMINRETGGVSNASSYTKDGTTVTGVPYKIEFSNGTKTTTLKIAQYTGVITYE